MGHLPDEGDGPSVSPVSEQEWSRMLSRIEGRKVIPVIGESLTIMSRGSPPQEMGLAACLASELGLAGAPPSSLNELAFRYLQVNPRGIEDLYVAIYEALPTSPTIAIPEPLRKLAQIRAFNLFITTSCDPYLALALNEVRFGRRSSGSTRVLAYERNRGVDIPERFSELDYPIVYHLFGKAQAAPLFAVTDEDVLEFVHSLQAPERQPPNLAQALRDQRLLVLGTRLSGWLARFFLRATANERLSKAKRADYLVDQAAPADPDQILFFEHFGDVKVIPMLASRFVDELSTRWGAKHPEALAAANVPTPSIPPNAGEVFLSYAREDVAVAQTLRERLEREAGVRVWLDKEAMRGGDDWERRIADALRACAVCVPVISSNVKVGTYRYVRSEWTQALKLRDGMRAGSAFVQPLVIDDTRADDDAIVPEIRALHWRRLQDEGDMKLFVAEVRAGAQK